jgi:hypothetical protein
MEEWQTRWGRVETGYATKNFMPRVGSHILWPPKRSEGVSVTRALLDNASVKNNLFRMHFTDSPNCDCQEACRETVTHKILHCQSFRVERGKLMGRCAEIWDQCKKFENLSFNLKLLLNPEDYVDIKMAKEISSSFNTFLAESGIQL